MDSERATKDQNFRVFSKLIKISYPIIVKDLRNNFDKTFSMEKIYLMYHTVACAHNTLYPENNKTKMIVIFKQE